MEIIADRFIFCEEQAKLCTFSFKSTAVMPAADFIALPETRYSANDWLTFKAVDCGRWEVVTARIHALTITVVSEVFQTIRQAACRMVRACKKFACSNLCRGCRVVPMVPMALRL